MGSAVGASAIARHLCTTATGADSFVGESGNMACESDPNPW
jgi:hypothetical protein